MNFTYFPTVVANGLNDSSPHSDYSVSKPPVPDNGWDALSFPDVPDSILSDSAFGTQDTMAVDLSSLDFTVDEPPEVVEGLFVIHPMNLLIFIFFNFCDIHQSSMHS